MSEPKTYSAEDLKERYQNLTSHASVEVVFTTELVGGQPAGEEELKAFIEHHMKIPQDRIEQVAAEIRNREIAKSVAPEEGELKEEEIYGVNVIRRDEYGPWLGDWMVKACLKCAASRLGLFVKKRGSKGAVAEMGSVLAVGASLNGEPRRIHITDSNGNPAQTYFSRFLGRVSTPQGSKSICHHAECIAPGAFVRFEFAWGRNAFTESDIADIFSVAQHVGLGSAKALERGKFQVNDLKIDI